MVKDHPPVQQPMRYGNVAFRFHMRAPAPARLALTRPCLALTRPCPRSWFDGVNACAEEKLRAALPSAAASDDNVRELAAYLCSSFGDRQRIDYGTGHELNFVALLLCLSKLQAFPASDAAAVVLVVFTSYISLCRCLQRT
jgi:serine/threonine-protein phosphatase 2A activator